MKKYSEFIKRKQFKADQSGFDADLSCYPLFDYQRAITEWALRRGKAAIFADTGLGKTLMQLTWAAEVAKHTGGDVLILAPLAVSAQTVEEARKFGIACGDVINYEQLHNIDTSKYVGVVLDESSILKGFNGSTRRQITEAFANTPYRLSCTATPSPNDFMELGTQSEFLGIMSQVEMLAMFFIHDGSDTSKWRLKGHGRKKFFEWLATWAIFISKPSDLGFEDSAHDLPPLHYHEHVIESGITDGLFAPIAQGLQERNTARRDTVDARVQLAAEIANSIDGQVLVWCHLNDESQKLADAIDNCVEVKGSDSNDHKVNAVKWFLGYDDLVLISSNRVESCQTANTSKTITKKTKKSESSNQENGSRKTPNIENSTWLNMPEITSQNSEGLQNSRQNTTESAEKNTQNAQIQESPQGIRLSNGRRQTRMPGLIKECGNMESQEMIISGCSASREESAQFAAAKTLEIHEAEDSMSITAIQQALYEDCSVDTAILALGNSEIVQSCLGLQQNILNKRLISKPSMFGYGLNLQQCNHMVFVGLSDSWEQFYQAVRRCWRFGQTKPVHVHIIAADVEGAVLANIKRKEQQNAELKAEMIAIMRDKSLAQFGKARTEKTEYEPVKAMEIPTWAA